MRKSITVQKEDELVVKKIAELMAKKRQAIQEVNDLQKKIEDTKETIKEITHELQNLIAGNEGGQVLSPSSVEIPTKGIVGSMIKFLETQTTPMTTEEIYAAIEPTFKNRKKPIGINSVRAYLSSREYFIIIKKKDIEEGTTPFKKSGWILDKDLLKQGAHSEK